MCFEKAIIRFRKSMMDFVKPIMYFVNHNNVFPKNFPVFTCLYGMYQDIWLAHFKVQLSAGKRYNLLPEFCEYICLQAKRDFGLWPLLELV
jgi:hypothetical protein